MKRLLAYLFIVLGLGLVFSVNAKSAIKIVNQKINLDLIFCTEHIQWYKSPGYSEVYLKDTFGGGCPTSGIKPKSTRISYKMFKKLNKNICYIKKQTKPLKVFSNSNPCNTVYGGGGEEIKYDGQDFYYMGTQDKTQIAKAEPSQTQEVVKLHDHLIKPDTWVYFITMEHTDGITRPTKFDSSHFLDNDKNMKSYTFDKNEKLFKYKRIRGGINIEYIRISKKLNDYWHKNIKTYNEGRKFYPKIKKHYLPKVLKELIDEYTENNELKEGLLAHFDEGIILKPKKKVKVAKVEELKQEEFKPETGDIDNEAPVIQIAEAITVNDTSYEIEGMVTDKAKKIFVEIDGQPVPLKKGKFKVKRYSPVDEQITIVAIDQWGNKSKPKLVNITIDIEETIVVEKLEPLNPTKIKAKVSENKVALIIGIENYSESPKATYANLDAKYFFDYARKAFGVKKQNINLLIDDKATLGSINKVLYKWLVGKVKANQTDLIIFFAGHGLASNDGKELYFLPQDGDPDLLSIMALSRTKLFEQIIKLNPKSVTMFLDTCYSGISRDEQMLLASARPIRIVADEQEGIPDNFTIFSATELDQISSGLKEANHGIFSYYLMKGLEGKADENKDYKITNGELLAYMDLNVSQKAAELGRQQNPSLAGDPDKILMSYR